MKKYLLLIFVVFVGTQAWSQNEFGAYLFPQLTSIHNSANREGDPIYQAKPTITYGGGVSFSHHLNKSLRHGPIRHGALASSMKTKKIIRFDLLYVEHHQNFLSEYRKSQDSIVSHEGKKRFGYIKIPVMYQWTFPINKLLNFSFYTGPQVSVLTKAKGGIVYWKHYDTYDYYDLPFSERGYFRRFTLDAIAGINLEIKASRWIHIIGGIRGDWSMTTVEKSDAIRNNYPTYGTLQNGDASRGNSHNTSLAFLIGFNYQLHEAEWLKTKQ